MSFLDSVSNFVSGAVNTLSDIAQVAAPLLFPQATLAMTAFNLISQAGGDAVNQAAQQLCKEAGMPKFLQDIIGKIVKEVLSQIQKPSDGECDKAARDKCGDSVRDFTNDLAKSIFELAKRIKCGGEDEEGGSSWLVAIAKAMGKAAGKHAERVAELANKIDSLNGDDPAQAKEATKLQNEMQGESQMLSLMQNAFATALKTIGESMSTMARKG